MSFIEGIEDLKGEKLLVWLFEFVQKIPYRISRFDSKFKSCSESVNISLEKGDCRHKSLLLYNLLLERNFDASKVVAIFDWKDLPIPEEILGILKKSGTRMVHSLLKVRINEHYSIYVDPTWNTELGRIGFPVTKRWDGKSHTAKVTNGKVEYYESEGFNERDYGVVLDEGEFSEFAEVLNMWLDEVCPIK